MKTCNKQAFVQQENMRTVPSTLHRNKCPCFMHHFVNDGKQQAWHLYPHKSLSLILYSYSHVALSELVAFSEFVVEC